MRSAIYLAVLSTILQSSLSVNIEYLGCSIDSHVRDMKRAYIYTYSVATCVRHCGDKGFDYAGMQWTNQCRCDNSYGRYGEDKTNKSCDITSKDGYPAGGEWRNSVYRASPKGNKLAIDNTVAFKSLLRPVSGATYQGCRKSNGAFQVMNDFNQWDVASCIQLCKGKNFTFAGVKKDKTCHCAHDVSAAKLVDNLECISHRFFNPVINGGDEALVTFDASTFARTKINFSDQSIGCFTFNGTIDERYPNMKGVEDKKIYDVDSVGECLSHCEGSVFAVIESFRLCYCCNRLPETATLSPSMCPGSARDGSYPVGREDSAAIYSVVRAGSSPSKMIDTRTK